MRRAVAATLLVTAIAAFAPSGAVAQSAHAQYTNILARERALRDARQKPTLKQIRAVIASYEALARRHRSSGYSDNALWQAGNLALLAYDGFGQALDRRTAVRLLKQMTAEYPTSSLVPRAKVTLAEIAARPVTPPPVVRAAERRALPDAPPPTAAAPGASLVTLRDIKRTPLPDGVRVTIEMDGESLYRQERLDNPARVFFDLKGTRPVAGLQDATMRFEEDVVPEIRLGRHPQNTTRVVMDMQGVDSYSVFTLYNPFRLVVDFRRAGVPAASVSAAAESVSEPQPAAPDHPPAAGTAGRSDAAIHASSNAGMEPSTGPATSPAQSAPAHSQADAKVAPAAGKIPLAARPVTSPGAPPSVPTANSDGRFSLARQLGLGISRIVIDPGHGGHDPGAKANGLTEAELVLDVALRLRKLLEKQTGIEVAMTRDRDVFVPLEERTAFANRQGADLFLSIHANASRNTRARGVETYYLNFASNPEAEAVAARENSASARSMHNLPDIVRAIALNNKIDESRDFAGMVQKAMVRRLSARNSELKDLGVKQAPFVVLIGAGMPSVLAEISFITNRQEGQLLKTAAYRQQIAEALLDAVLGYQQSLKNVRKVALR